MDVSTISSIGLSVMIGAMGIGWAVSSIIRAIKGTSREDDL